MVRSINKSDRTWFVSFFAIGVCYFAYYWIPYIRGYAFYGKFSNDHLVHMGLINDILTMNRVPDLTYPASHLLGSGVVEITGVSVEILNPLLSLFFMLSTSIFAFLFARDQLSHTYGLWVLFASLPLIFSQHRFMIIPWLFCLTFLPFALYLSKKTIQGSNRSVVLLSILIPLLTLYHPLTGIFILIAMVVYSATLVKTEQLQIPTKGTASLLIGSIIIPFWHLYLQTIDGVIRTTLLSILNQSQGTGQKLSSQATESSYTIYQMIFHFGIPNWGILILYLSLAGIAIVYLLWSRDTAKGLSTNLALQFSISMAIGIPFVIFEIHAASMYRAFQYSLVICIFAIGGMIWKLSTDREKTLNTIIRIFVIGLVITSGIYGLFVGYSDNRHMSNGDIEAYDWLYDSRNDDLDLYSSSTNNKFVYYEYGYVKGREMTRRNAVSATQNIAPHFGYHENNTISARYDEGYLTVRINDLEWYRDEPKWRLELAEYVTQGDLETLHNDPGASKIYSNGDASHWLTRPN